MYASNKCFPLPFAVFVVTGTHMDPNVCVHVVHTCMTVCLKDFLCLTAPVVPVSKLLLTRYVS